MKLQLANLKTERQWRATTGCDQRRFEKLMTLFTASYRQLYGCSVSERQVDLDITPSLRAEEEPLFSLKAGLTYDVLGFVHRVVAVNTKRNQTLGLKVFEHAL